MTRSEFAGSANDFLYRGAPFMRPTSGTLTMWDAATGGTQHTDLLLNGAPVSSITVGEDGFIPAFQGPDGVTSMWADEGTPGGPRRRLMQNGAATDAGVAGYVSSPTSATSAALSATIAQIAAWAKSPDTLITGAITRNAQGVVTSAVVKWPDGTPGVFTTDTIGSLNTIDAYHVTYVGTGGTKTFTQPAITRDVNGAATNVPSMVVS